MTAPTRSTAPDNRVPSERAHWPAVAVAAVAVAVAMFNNTSMNLALPALAADLDLDSTDMRVVVVSYSTVFAALLVPAGFATGRLGARRTLVAGLIVTSVGGALGLFADTPAVVIGARVVLGAGAALVTPASLAAIIQVVPAAKRSAAIAVWTGITVVGTAFGQVAGGAAIAWHGWQATFAMTAVVGAVCAVAVLAVLAPLPAQRSDALSPVTALLLAVGMIALVPALNLMTDVPVPASIVAVSAVGCLAAVLTPAHRRREIFGDLDRDSIAGQMVNGAAFLAVAGAMFVLTQLLQAGHGLSALAAGTAVLPTTAATIVGAVSAPVLARTVGPRLGVVTGLLTTALGCVAAAASTQSVPLVIGAMTIVGLGIGLAMPIATELVVATAPADRVGTRTAANDAVQEIGFALGVTFVGSALAVSYSMRAGPDAPSPGALLTDAGGPALAALLAASRNAYLVEAALLLAVGGAVAAILPRAPITRDEGTDG
ncbi:MFS transporter [Nocardia sp. NPDC058705]|uniref:MFS transporter n=1 Tax=Nocardia sp. NPDC058705 TaxID=3346609 RepID=UPI0036B90498